MTPRAYKERFYPTPEQAELLARSFGCARFVWNDALRLRTDAYYQCGESMSHSALEKRLVTLKAEQPWLAEVSSVILQQTLRDQQQAFKNFWDKRAKYPRFKSKHRRQSIRLTRAAFRYRDNQLFIAKSKDPLPVRWSRKLPSAPSRITISKDRAGRYFISCLCDVEVARLPVTPKVIGIDVGLSDLFVTSHGVKIGNPRHLKGYEQRLAYRQRQLAKKQKGSANRAKARMKVARLHAKIADCRRDHLHQLTRCIINENQVIAVEDLNIKALVKHPTLAKSISDASWGEFVRQLDYKAAWAGRQLVKIDRWFPSSKRCHHCGHLADSMPLNVRIWDCPSCGAQSIDRDVNAAKNILTAGLAGLACGATGTGTAAHATV
jgi:putative transposase